MDDLSARFRAVNRRAWVLYALNVILWSTIIVGLAWAGH